MNQKELKNILNYNPESGLFIWNHNALRGRGWNTRFAGKVAGTLHPFGYVKISINGKKWNAHRLAFLYMIGRLPKYSVDHINGQGFDNRWHNLREATYQENNQNQALKKSNKTGVSGVRFKADRGKWSASIKHKYKYIFLGYFKEFSDAVDARVNAEKKYGFHNNHGTRKSKLGVISKSCEVYYGRGEQ